jgi:hypothetical protein
MKGHIDVIRAKFWVYEHSEPIVLLLVLITGVGLFLMRESTGNLAVTTVGVVLSLAYFLQKQKLDEIKLFKELFVDFNKRYEALNSDLTALKAAKSDKALLGEEEKTLVSYFNLCAEEYLFNCRGYIHPDVWKAWTNGMADIFANPRVLAYWQKEWNTNSYYGLPQDILAFFRQCGTTSR